MNKNYVDFYSQLEEKIRSLGEELPGPFSGFSRLHKKAIESGVLDQKTKELIALSISVAVHCEGCIAYHVHDAIKAGANRQEMLEAIGVAVLMGGAPASVYGTIAVDAIGQFLESESGTATESA